MKILVVGSKGMLGGELTRQGKAKEGEVIGWDREEIDITDKNQVEEKISRLSPDVIVNCAAYNNVDAAEKDGRELALKVNGAAVGYLAETAVRLGAVLIHYSSDYVFRGDRPEGYNEDDQPDPQSWYGKTKYESEKQVTGYPSSEAELLRRTGRLQVTGLKFYLIRTSRLFGSAGTGEGAKESFVEKILKLGKEKGELEVIDEEVSSPTYAPDLAKATFELLGSGKPWGIYHRTNDGACTWYEWAKKIFELACLDLRLARLAGMSVKVKPAPSSRFPRPAPRPRFSILLTTKLPAMRRWEEALADGVKALAF